MNVKELKKLADEWWNNDGFYGAARNMHDAIMALPDDPQAEHEDLVEMAQIVTTQMKNVGFVTTSAENLARTVIERFGKREPETFVEYSVRADDNPAYSFSSKEAALKFVREANNHYRIFKIVGTEEV